VKAVQKNRFTLETNTELKPQMGLLFVGKEEMGSKIMAVKKSGKKYEVELLQKNLEIKKGQKVYLNSNETLGRELQKNWSSREHMKKIPLKFLVQGMYNEPLLVKAIDPEGREVYAQTISFLSPANNRFTTEEFIKEELSSLGTTVYKMEGFECFLQEGLFLNHRELKDLRRELVEKMNKARIDRNNRVVEIAPVTMTRSKAQIGLNVLLRTTAQVEAIVQIKGVKSVILDFEFGKNYESSLKLLRQAGIKTGIATTRILKPQEYYNLRMIGRLNPDFILVRNLGALEYLKRETSIPLMGDFSLNVTNSRTLAYLVGKGLESVNLSYDLNQEQLLDLVKHGDPSKMEVTVHQYMPEFHMEHCVFAAFLSSGSSFKDCGKPCERHDVKLKDPYGNWHFLKADHECRNTFFKATPQSAGFLIDRLLREGVASIRLEALHESASELLLKVQTYLDVLHGKISAGEAMKKIEVVESYGLGLGQMKKNDDYTDRKKS
jgi:putative protease